MQDILFMYNAFVFFGNTNFCQICAMKEGF